MQVNQGGHHLCNCASSKLRHPDSSLVLASHSPHSPPFPPSHRVPCCCDATQRNALPPPYPGPLFHTRSVCPRGTMPIRSKRNFKELQLNVSPAEPPEPEPPVPTRMAPPATKPAGGGGKKRPPPMNLKPKVVADAPTGDATNDGLLAVAPGPTSAPASANTSTNMKRMTYHTTLSNTLANLDLNAEVKYDLRDEDLKDLNELGQGNGGSVKKVEHVPTHTIMAKKVLSSFVPLRLGTRSHCVVVFGRSSSSTQSPLCASRSCASCRSCTTATRTTSSRFTARSCPTPISASAWNLWTRVHSMVSTSG